VTSNPAFQQRIDELAAARPSTGADWRCAAACRSTDPDLFFPISGTGRALEQVTEAQSICADCPVTRECLTFALRTHQIHGIWGGMTKEERYLDPYATPLLLAGAARA
jgi:WhiB family redox-sensing transcriptional regulator